MQLPSWMVMPVSFFDFCLTCLLSLQSELHTWLPSVSCIYYVGTKDQRTKLFTQVRATCLGYLRYVLMRYTFLY